MKTRLIQLVHQAPLPAGFVSDGFTLVEIMVVVVIISLLTALAAVNLLRVRHNANETSAIATLKAIGNAEQEYRAAQNPPTYTSFAPLYTAAPPYLSIAGYGSDTQWERQGYTFDLAGSDVSSFCVTGVPNTALVTGARDFVTDASGMVYASTDEDPACTAAAPFQWDGNGAVVE